MKIAKLIIMIALIALGALSASVKEDVLAVNRALERAYLNEDIEALEGYLSDDHIHNNVFGMMMNKDSFLSDIRTGVLTFNKYETPEYEIKVLGDTAILTGFIEAEANRSGNVVAGRFLFTRIYALRNGQWKVIHFHNTRVVPVKAV